MQKSLAVARLGALAGAVLLSGGCASKYVEAVVKNQTGGVVSLVEVDYPSASFGKETMAAGTEYHYRFKILGSGDSKVLWTDAGRVEHTVAGPRMEEGQQGRVEITLSGDKAVWVAALGR